jgi:hypothetical protein
MRARAFLGACALILAALAAASSAGADPQSGTNPKAKASSFAPHHTKGHAFGTPIAKPILHKRKKRTQPAAPATAPAAPIK